MSIKIGINGFGRIGRTVFRHALKNKDIEIVAINASYEPTLLAHMLKYDSVHGILNEQIKVEDRNIIINGKNTIILNEREPKKLPWRLLGVNYVVEATGKFREYEKVKPHLENGAKKVIITAPAKGEDITIVMGVNHEKYDPFNHHVISNASCTTNCLAPVAKVLHEQFGIEQGMMTTVHSYTNDQRVLDNMHKDLRRARSAGQSIIPTTTGAAKAVGLVLPELKGKLNGISLRVPTPNVSIVDLVVTLEKEVTVEEVNNVLKEASITNMKGIIEYCEEPLVSVDFNGNPHSAIVDSLSTMVVGNKQVKVLAWYDNEWAYSNRIIDLIQYMAEKDTKVLSDEEREERFIKAI